MKLNLKCNIYYHSELVAVINGGKEPSLARRTPNTLPSTVDNYNPTHLHRPDTEAARSSFNHFPPRCSSLFSLTPLFLLCVCVRHVRMAWQLFAAPYAAVTNYITFICIMQALFSANEKLFDDYCKSPCVPCSFRFDEEVPIDKCSIQSNADSHNICARRRARSPGAEAPDGAVVRASSEHNEFGIIGKFTRILCVFYSVHLNMPIDRY